MLEVNVYALQEDNSKSNRITLKKKKMVPHESISFPLRVSSCDKGFLYEGSEAFLMEWYPMENGGKHYLRVLSPYTVNLNDMTRKERRRTFGHVRPARIHISLHFRTVWSESSLDSFWKSKDAKFLHVDNEDSDQTVRMRRLTWVFVGGTCQKIRFLTWRPISVHLYLLTVFTPSIRTP